MDGFLKAKGDYICFLDSDDYLAPDALALLYGIAKEKNVDMVVGNFDRVCDNWGLVKKKSGFYPRHLTDRLITKSEIMPLFMGLEYLCANANHVWGVYVWGRLYRRSCIQNALPMDAELLFPSSENFRFEDDSFNIAVASFLNSIWITDTIVSHYRKGGVTNNDMPYIRRGGHLYDERFERCFQYGCEQVLPMILGRYVDQLQRDLVNQIHFCLNSDEKIYKFLLQELSNRKIVLWIKRNWPMKLVRTQNEAILHAIKDNDIDGIILLAHQREKKLESYSWRMKLIGFYQKVVDKIGYYC